MVREGAVIGVGEAPNVSPTRTYVNVLKKDICLLYIDTINFMSISFPFFLQPMIKKFFISTYF